MQKTLCTLFSFLSLVAVGNAVFLGRSVSVVDAKGKEMPITKHKKEAGGDYHKGSPLYEKQQDRKEKGIDGDTSKPKSGGEKVVHVTTPPEGKAADPDHWWEHVYGGEKNHMGYGLSYFVTYFTFTMLAALIWTKCGKGGSPGMGARTKEGYDERKNNGLYFAYGLFSCDHCFGHHAHVCLCAFCCAPLRLADTWNKEPSPLVKSFWSALIIVACLAGLNQLTFGFTGIVLLGICVHLRQKMRQKYGLESGGSTWVFDCCSWFWCPFCTMAQEARQVEFVLPLQKTVS